MAMKTKYDIYWTMYAIMIDDSISINKNKLFTVVGPNILLGRKASNQYFTVSSE